MSNLKRIHEEEPEGESSWAISYGDMITLLLSFFVIFFSTDAKKQKEEVVYRQLAVEMGSLSASINSIHNEVIDDKSLLKDLDVKTHLVGESLIVTFGKNSFFESGRTKVKKESLVILKEFVTKFLPYAGTYQLSIKAFTDSTPVRKEKNRFQDNLELSVLRGVAAMRVLQGFGIPLHRMEIAGVGEMKSIGKIVELDKNMTDEEINSLSRTIVLVIKHEKEIWP